MSLLLGQIQAPFRLARVSWRFVLGLVVALTCLFVVAHGCHGPDEDHEPGVHHSP